MAKKVAKKPAKKAGTAVAVHKPQLPAAPVTFLEFLDRASRDPEFDAAKFQIVLAAKERQDIRAAEAAYDDAMAAAQKDMAPIRADMKSDKPKNKYASAVKLDAAIRPVYSRHGFAVSFDTDECPHPLTVRVVAYVSCAGHKKRHFIDIPADGKGPSGGDVMSRTHAVGSAVTYGRGILLRSIFNLVVDKGSDDDGRGAGGNNSVDTEPHTISPDQVKRIQTLMSATNTPATRVLDYASKLSKAEIDTINDIPVKCFSDVVAQLEARKASK